MSDIKMNLSFPLDTDGFFRRECPFCFREFKILLRKEELVDLTQKGIDSYMIDQKEEVTDEEEEIHSEYFCPYCGQKASHDCWWTQEQLAYINVVTKNMIAKMINEQLIRPFKKTSGRTSGGLISIKFEVKDMKHQKPWISPEVNDMNIFCLPCCKRKMKIEENWTGKVYCFFCGFPHKT